MYTETVVQGPWPSWDATVIPLASFVTCIATSLDEWALKVHIPVQALRLFLLADGCGLEMHNSQLHSAEWPLHCCSASKIR